MNNQIHICYCVNRKMLEPLCVSAHSAAAAVAGQDLTIWVFHPDFSSKDIDMLQGVIDSLPAVTLKTQPMNVETFGGIQGLHGEVMPFAKLLLPRLMEGEADRIVFLDADTVVIEGLDDLYYQDLEGYMLGAVSYEPLGRTLEAGFFRSRGLDLEKDSFNSGVMLIDVKKWADAAKSEQLIELVKSVDPNEAKGDQPFLNLAFYDNFLPLRIRYNKRAGPDTRLQKRHTTDGILHFVGIPKPWDVGGRWLTKTIIYTISTAGRLRCQGSQL